MIKKLNHGKLSSLRSVLLMNLLIWTNFSQDQLPVFKEANTKKTNLLLTYRKLSAISILKGPVISFCPEAPVYTIFFVWNSFSNPKIFSQGKKFQWNQLDFVQANLSETTEIIKHFVTKFWKETVPVQFILMYGLSGVSRQRKKQYKSVEMDWC